MTAPAIEVPAVRPSEDLTGYRKSLGAFPTGITVITASHGENRVGVTANSFGSVSLDPALVLWSLKLNAPSLPVFRDSKHFTVNVLAWHQQDLAMHFSTPREDKFADIDHNPGLGGGLLLDGCSTIYECQLVHEFIQGDHVVMIGQVEHFRDYHREPLVFYRGNIRWFDQPVLP